MIANGSHDIEGQAADFLYYGAGAVDVFDFSVFNYQLTSDAIAVVKDVCGIHETDANGLYNGGLGHELIDKLEKGEAVFFMGGDQWPYVQLLTAKQDTNGYWHGNAASQIISVSNQYGLTTVGGTSAGMAILGNYVYTSQYARGESELSSHDILANYYVDKFYGTNGPPSIASGVRGLKWMGNIITEPHFTDPGKALTDLNDLQVYRLGRLLCFMGSIAISPPKGAAGNPFVEGIAVDNNTALKLRTVARRRSWGQRHVYFAWGVHGYLSASLSALWPQGFIDVGDFYLQEFSANDEFDFADGFAYGTSATDRLAVANGDVLWLEGEPFF